MMKKSLIRESIKVFENLKLNDFYFNKTFKKNKVLLQYYFYLIVKMIWSLLSCKLKKELYLK